jgi:hypothetical protein
MLYPGPAPLSLRPLCRSLSFSLASLSLRLPSSANGARVCLLSRLNSAPSRHPTRMRDSAFMAARPRLNYEALRRARGMTILFLAQGLLLPKRPAGEL